jgi:hypothetical protein
MPIATRTFLAFVNSTFEDLKEERNTVQREVFTYLCYRTSIPQKKMTKTITPI